MTDCPIVEAKIDAWYFGGARNMSEKAITMLEVVWIDWEANPR
jgi:hypothetical protein